MEQKRKKAESFSLSSESIIQSIHCPVKLYQLYASSLLAFDQRFIRLLFVYWLFLVKCWFKFIGQIFVFVLRRNIQFKVGIQMKNLYDHCSNCSVLFNQSAQTSVLFSGFTSSVNNLKLVPAQYNTLKKSQRLFFKLTWGFPEKYVNNFISTAREAAFNQTQLTSKRLLIRLEWARNSLWSGSSALELSSDQTQVRSKWPQIRLKYARIVLWSDSSAHKSSSDQTQVRLNRPLIKLKCAQIVLWSDSSALELSSD